MDDPAAIEAKFRQQLGSLVYRVTPSDRGDAVSVIFSDDGGRTCEPLDDIPRENVDGVLGTLTKERVLGWLRDKRDSLAWMPQRVVSGGQTGVDRAALDWAIANGIDHGGWCPAGRRSEDGPISARYRLTETQSAEYLERTRLNVADSDATLVLNSGALDGGTAMTVAIAQKTGKPHLVVDLDGDVESAAAAIRSWLAETRPAVLNVAGPRESKRPGVAAIARRLLDATL